MKILGIDSCVKFVRVFAQNGKKLKCIEREDVSGTDSLLPFVGECLTAVDMKITDVENLAVCLGPGSWTGARVCVSTALGLMSAIKEVKLYTFSSFDMAEFGVKNFDCSVVSAYATFVFARNKNGETRCVDKVDIQKSIEQGAVVVGERALFDGQVVTSVDFSKFIQGVVKNSKVSTIADLEPIYLKLSQAEEQRLLKENKKV